MAQVGTALTLLAKPCSVLTIALILPFTISAVPAQAQGIFGLFRAFSQPAAPTPPPQPFGYQPDPGVEPPRRKARPRPTPVVVEQPEIKKPVEPKPVGEIANPVPALLADSTLCPGDMVMFPDGLRVFTGRPWRLTQARGLQTLGPGRQAPFPCNPQACRPSHPSRKHRVERGCRQVWWQARSQY